MEAAILTAGAQREGLNDAAYMGRQLLAEVMQQAEQVIQREEVAMRQPAHQAQQYQQQAQQRQQQPQQQQYQHLALQRQQQPQQPQLQSPPGDVAGGQSRHSNRGRDPLPCPFIHCTNRPHGGAKCRACSVEHCLDPGCNTKQRSLKTVVVSAPARAAARLQTYPSLPPQGALPVPEMAAVMAAFAAVQQQPGTFSLQGVSAAVAGARQTVPTQYPQQQQLPGTFSLQGVSAAVAGARQTVPTQYPQQQQLPGTFPLHGASAAADAPSPFGCGGPPVSENTGVSNLRLFGSPAYTPVWAHSSPLPAPAASWHMFQSQVTPEQQVQQNKQQ